VACKQLQTLYPLEQWDVDKGICGERAVQLRTTSNMRSRPLPAKVQDGSIASPTADPVPPPSMRAAKC